MTRRLNELKSNLSDAGIEFERSHGKETILRITSFQQQRKNSVASVASVFSEGKQQVSDDGIATLFDATEKIASQPKLLKTQNNDGNDGNDGKKAHLLGRGESKKKEGEYVDL